MSQFSVESRKRAESEGEEKGQHSSYLLLVLSCPHPTVPSFHWVFCCMQFCLASNNIGSCTAACKFGYTHDYVLYFYCGSSRHSFIVLRDKIFSFGLSRCDLSNFRHRGVLLVACVSCAKVRIVLQAHSSACANFALFFSRLMSSKRSRLAMTKKCLGLRKRRQLTGMLPCGDASVHDAVWSRPA